jgi:beta-galactosidase
VEFTSAPYFDDSKWETGQHAAQLQRRRLFRKLISHSGGDRGTYKGLSWYRKHFKLPAAAGIKVFLEFEGMRQAGDIFLNGKQVGLYENGVTAYGIDITDAVHFGDQENVLAVKVDNPPTTRSAPPTAPLPLMERQRLQPRPRRHQPPRLAARHRQDLPDAAALLRPGDQGVYIHAATSTSPKRPRRHRRSEVHNASGDRATVGCRPCRRSGRRGSRQFDGDPVDMVDGEKTV